MGQREEGILHARTLRELLSNVALVTPEIRAQAIAHVDALLKLLGVAKDEPAPVPPKSPFKPREVKVPEGLTEAVADLQRLRVEDEKVIVQLARRIASLESQVEPF